MHTNCIFGGRMRVYRNILAPMGVFFLQKIEGVIGLIKRNLRSILLIMAMLFAFAGCGKNTEKSELSKSEGYPMTIVDSYEREVVIEEEPQTVVSVAPNITEAIYAIGAGDKLIGRTDYCDYPAEVSDVESVGSLTDPSIEKIVELDPDIVVASTHFQKEVLEKLEEAGIKVVVLYGEESFEGVYETIDKLGKVMNREANAQEVVDGMKAKVEDVKSKVEGLEKPSVYYVVGYGESGDFTATKETFIAQMIEMAGGTNAADDAEGWKYSLEKLVEKDPDVLVCSKYFDSKAGIESANGYSDLRAVKEGKLYEIDNNKLDRQGPRLADGLEELAELLHPEAFK